MKIPTILIRKKKLRATTARRARSLGLPDEMDYEQMAEPNMKLSRALLIVLVLHVVAVAGIVAFNTIKTREDEMPAAIAPPALASAVSADPGSALVESAVSADRGSALGTAHATIAPSVAPNELMKTSAAPKPAEKVAPPAASTVKDSGKIYTVVKGDNPVTIARHLKVSEADLLELNQITDPRRLQINQKLRVPEARLTTKAKAD